jgi:transcriptional regulator of acetoin/glycerol metabolism
MDGQPLQTPTRIEPKDGAGRSERRAQNQPQLYLVLEADRPLAGSARHGLQGIDTIVIGRGADRTVEREGNRLTLRVADPWMSTSHAKLTRVADRWVLEDTQSRNGVVLNGEASERAPLSDGDVFECGRTFFLLRERVPTGSGDPLDLDSGALLHRKPGLATLLPSFAHKLEQLARVAASPDIAVLIQGETGTGKELAAHAVHSLSGRSGTFVPLNCGAISSTLVEAELFGHKRGAFSGAVEDRPGMMRASDGGTLFLDEVGELPLATQPAFLRALQEGEVRAVGAATPSRVDLRVVAATHRDLDAWVREGRFREDLRARLSGYTVLIPPLRERKEELGLLIASLLPRVAPERAATLRFHPTAVRALLKYGWPRNVRELEKCLATSALLSEEGEILLEDLPAEVTREAPLAQPEAEPVADESALSEKDRALKSQLMGLLQTHGHNVSALARVMGKDRKQIRRWLKRLGLRADE